MIRVGAAIEHHDDQFVGGRIVIYLLEIIRMACTWTDEHDEGQCRRQRRQAVTQRWQTVTMEALCTVVSRG